MIPGSLPMVTEAFPTPNVIELARQGSRASSGSAPRVFGSYVFMVPGVPFQRIFRCDCYVSNGRLR
jgi:hypothetical protein